MGSLQLRNILRRVNTEYSALLRDRAATDRSARLARLKTERKRLMLLLASSVPPLRLVGNLPIPMSASGMASSPGVSTNRN